MANITPCPGSLGIRIPHDSKVHYSDASHISTGIPVSTSSRDWQKHLHPATSPVLPFLRETGMDFGSLSFPIALRLQNFYSQPGLKTAGLNKICPFSASEPGQRRGLAEFKSLPSPASLRHGHAANVKLDARLQAASPVSVGSQLQHLQPSEAVGLWQKLARIFQKCLKAYSRQPSQRALQTIQAVCYLLFLAS